MARVCFGEFSVDWISPLECRDLKRWGVPIHLEPRTSSVLACLVDHALARRQGDSREGVTTNAFLETVWADSVPERSVVAQQIRILRTKLDPDRSKRHLHVETVGHNGYRLRGPVRMAADSAIGDADGDGLDGSSSTPYPVGALPTNFVGRRRELKDLRQLWRGRPIQHAAIIGPSGSGKTSLVRFLSATGTRSARAVGQTAADSRPLRFVQLNFRDPRMESPAFLFMQILRPLGDTGDAHLDRARFFDRAVDLIDVPTVVLCDDLHKAAEYKDLDQVWGCLRALGEEPTVVGKLSYVVTARTSASIAKMAAHGSPFYNALAHTVSLGPLTEEEARELIVAGAGSFTDNDVKWMLEKSGRWPLLLQLLCRARVAADAAGSRRQWREEGLSAIARYPQLLPKKTGR